MGKTLIAYYSRRGENYVNGIIKDLSIGNTETVANKIAVYLDADIFRIETVSDYPEDYTETTNVAMLELNANARPKLKSSIDNIGEYDMVFLGYPNWWGTMPMCVCTFLESYDFSGKTILPFCTHEGSGLGHSEKDIVKFCPDSDVKKGLAIRGSRVTTADNEIAAWLNDNKLI